MFAGRSRSQASEGRAESMSAEDAGEISSAPAEVETHSMHSDSVDPTRALVLSKIEHIEELILNERFEEALAATQANRLLAAALVDLLKLLWIQESQALTGLGRLDEAEQAMTEAEKL